MATDPEQRCTCWGQACPRRPCGNGTTAAANKIPRNRKRKETIVEEPPPLEEIDAPAPETYVPRQTSVPLPLPTVVDLSSLIDELPDAEVAEP